MPARFRLAVTEPVRLVAHDPRWRDVFRTEARLLRRALGTSVSGVHHVGSTAVPCIRAKPIVDIALESQAYPPGESALRALAALGYEHRGESGVEGRHWFVKGVPRSVHLHWCRTGGSVARDQVALSPRGRRGARPGPPRGVHSAAPRHLSGRGGDRS